MNLVDTEKQTELCYRRRYLERCRRDEILVEHPTCHDDRAQKTRFDVPAPPTATTGGKSRTVRRERRKRIFKIHYTDSANHVDLYAGHYAADVMAGQLLRARVSPKKKKQRQFVHVRTITIVCASRGRRGVQTAEDGGGCGGWSHVSGASFDSRAESATESP